MATLLLGCGALVSDRLKKKQQSRIEHQKEYASRFEEFKAENQRWEARRQSYRNNSYGSNSTEPASDPVAEMTTTTHDTTRAGLTRQPPSYYVATGITDTQSMSSTSSRSNSFANRGSVATMHDGHPARLEHSASQRSTLTSASQYIAIGTRDLGGN